MSKIFKNIIKIITILLILIFVVFLLNNYIKAEDAKNSKFVEAVHSAYKELQDMYPKNEDYQGEIIYSTGIIARTVSNLKSKLYDIEISDIFKINKCIIAARSGGKYADILYKTLSCLYHTQSQSKNGGYDVVGVLDINANKLTITTEDGVTMVVDDKDHIAVHQMAYLIYKSVTESEELISDNGRFVDAYNGAIYYKWVLGNDENGTGAFKTFLENTNLDGSWVYDVTGIEIEDGSQAGLDYKPNNDEPSVKDLIDAAQTASTAYKKIKHLTQNKTTPVMEEVGDYLYLGPFNATFGSLSEGSHYDVKDSSNGSHITSSATYYTKNANGNFEIAKTGLESGENFYVRVENKYRDISGFKVTLTVSNAYYYKARILLLASPSVRSQRMAAYYGSKKNDKETTIWEIKNQKEYGNLQINKVDSQNQSIVLEGVEFKISNNNGYIQLSNASGAKVGRVIGKVTISKTNTATDTEYKINYVNSESDATIFATDSNGQIIIENLQVNSQNSSTNATKLTYTVKEITPKDGYAIVGEINVQLQKDTTTYVTNSGGTQTKGNLTNQPLYTELGGYVWLDTPPDTKDAAIDNQYTSGSNDRLMPGIKVQLVDKTNNSVVKETQTNENGRYAFTNILISKLADYYVRFEYDGLTYTSVAKNITLINGSKAVEVLAERTDLNNKYSMISGEISVDNTIRAVTDPNEVNIRTLFDNNSEMILNINLGLCLREQPDNSISEDIQSVVVRLNGYEYTYNYATRDKYIREQDENKNAFNVGVKFGNQYTNRYTRPLYTSDIEAVSENRATMEVFVIYKITIKNEATTLNSKVSSIVNYYDKNYSIEAVGKTLEGGTISDYIATTTDLSYNNEVLNKEIINCDIDLEPGAMSSMYIRYSINNETVIGLLNNNETLYNASEMLSYTTYYGANTYEGSNVTAGNIYAGIDEDSTPNNAVVTVVEDSSRLDVKTASGEYEDDVDIAPSLLLQAEGARTLSGIVWEDSTTYDENNGRLGNGEYATNENVVSGVKVELIDLSTGEIAKYSNGADAVTTSQTDGTYRFGINDRDNNNYIGILPGNYVIRYTYSNDCEIRNTNGDVIKKINVNDYKSTIVKSDKVKEAINAQDISEENQNNEVYRWYIGEETRYSDALDNISLRNEANNMIINYSTVSTSLTEMQANTPALHVPIEFTTTDVVPAMYYDSEGNLQSQVFVSENRNIDFGIAERAKPNITVEKKITSLEIRTSTGNVLVQGDPSDANAIMQYVMTGLDGLVPAQISSEVLQGAEAIVGYTITFTNNSEVDYYLDIANQESIEYYYYGTTSRTLQAKAITINKVVDYLSGGMKVTSETKAITANELKEAGLISEEVCNTLSNGEYVISIIEDIGELAVGESKQIQLSASKAIASSSEDLSYTNYVEIIEYTGTGRTFEDTVPGNYDPENTQTKENDSDYIELVITDPTGKGINYTIYIGVTALTLIIVAIGAVIIKKKVIKS